MRPLTIANAGALVKTLLAPYPTVLMRAVLTVSCSSSQSGSVNIQILTGSDKQSSGGNYVSPTILANMYFSFDPAITGAPLFESIVIPIDYEFGQNEVITVWGDASGASVAWSASLHFNV